MSNVIKNPRNGCALHGALQTVQEIRGAVPVVHANAGCGVVNYLAQRNASGGGARYSGLSIPGTAAQERHVIFGGASRLREQIKNTIKVQKGDLYVILNSCESAMVGDDVDAMTREIVEQGEPVVDTLVAGFNGGIHYGYEHVLADILKSLDGIFKSDIEKDERLVNIFGIVPDKDPYWQGNLIEIKRILNGFGLKANVFFGAGGSVQQLKAAKNAAVSIVFTKWGELPAKVLKEKYDVPVIIRPSLPADANGVQELATALAEIVELDASKVDEFIADEEDFENNILYRVRDEIFEYGLSKTAAFIGEEEQAIRIGSFLKNRLGVEFSAIVLTDALKKDEEHETDNGALLASISENVYIANDQKEINDILRGSGAEVIFGSSLEKDIAGRLNVPLVEVSYPIVDRVILSDSRVGARGAINLIQEYITIIQSYEKGEKYNYLAAVKGKKNKDFWTEISNNKSVARINEKSKRLVNYAGGSI